MFLLCALHVISHSSLDLNTLVTHSLVDGSNQDQFQTDVVKPITLKFVQLGVGPSAKSCFFISSDGRVYATGLNDRGQLGIGNKTNVNSIVEVELSESVTITSIYVSDSHTVAR